MWWSAEISIASILLNLIRKFDRNLWCLLIHYIELEVIPNYYFDVTVVLVAADLTWLLMSVIQLETLLGDMSFSIFFCATCAPLNSAFYSCAATYQVAIVSTLTVSLVVFFFFPFLAWQATHHVECWWI